MVPILTPLVTDGQEQEEEEALLPRQLLATHPLQGPQVNTFTQQDQGEDPVCVLVS